MQPAFEALAEDAGRRGDGGVDALPLLRRPRRADHRTRPGRLPEPGRHPRRRRRRRCRPRRARPRPARPGPGGPQRYFLVYGTLVPGYRAPETQFAAHLADHRDWAGDHPAAPADLHRFLLLWTRLHGVLSLELAGHFTGMAFHPELLFEAEPDSLPAPGPDHPKGAGPPVGRRVRPASGRGSGTGPGSSGNGSGGGNGGIGGGAGSGPPGPGAGFGWGTGRVSGSGGIGTVIAHLPRPGTLRGCVYPKDPP
ncbi:TetR/AcrR family transcriptional regulator [Kitasatospora sp. Ki12]